MRMRKGDRGLREVAAAGLVALLLASETAVNGQSASDFERFQLYNACRPMGLRGHLGQSGHEDGIKITLDHITPVVKSRLRAERLYSPLKSESNGAFLEVSVNVAEVSPEVAAHTISLQYHKLITDAASGLENTAATWITDSGGSGGHDPETISEVVTLVLDRFLKEYLRVNEGDCRPASFTATGRNSCAGQWGGTECWMGLSNEPGCYVWNNFLLPEQTVTWTGECAGEFAQGQGTLKWVWDRGRGKETAEETGYLEAGKNRHGPWIRRYGNGTVHEGPYIEGKRHGQRSLTRRGQSPSLSRSQKLEQGDDQPANGESLHEECPVEPGFQLGQRRFQFGPGDGGLFTGANDSHDRFGLLRLDSGGGKLIGSGERVEHAFSSLPILSLSGVSDHDGIRDAPGEGIRLQ